MPIDMYIKCASTSLLVFVGLAACRPDDRTITFAQVEILGIHTSTGTGTPAAAEATLGYRGINYATVPVVTKVKGPDGKEADATTKSTEGQKTDALSVFGHFDASTGLPGSGTSIGKYFATGVAAQTLADGASRGLGPAMVISKVAQNATDPTAQGEQAKAVQEVAKTLRNSASESGQ